MLAYTASAKRGSCDHCSPVPPACMGSVVPAVPLPPPAGGAELARIRNRPSPRSSRKLAVVKGLRCSAPSLFGTRTQIRHGSPPDRPGIATGALRRVRSGERERGHVQRPVSPAIPYQRCGVAPPPAAVRRPPPHFSPTLTPAPCRRRVGFQTPSGSSKRLGFARREASPKKLSTCTWRGTHTCPTLFFSCLALHAVLWHPPAPLLQLQPSQEPSGARCRRCPRTRPGAGDSVLFDGRLRHGQGACVLLRFSSAHSLSYASHRPKALQTMKASMPPLLPPAGLEVFLPVLRRTAQRRASPAVQDPLALHQPRAGPCAGRKL